MHQPRKFGSIPKLECVMSHLWMSNHTRMGTIKKATAAQIREHTEAWSLASFSWSTGILLYNKVYTHTTQTKPHTKPWAKQITFIHFQYISQSEVQDARPCLIRPVMPTPQHSPRTASLYFNLRHCPCPQVRAYALCRMHPVHNHLCSARLVFNRASTTAHKNEGAIKLSKHGKAFTSPVSPRVHLPWALYFLVFCVRVPRFSNFSTSSIFLSSLFSFFPIFGRRRSIYRIVLQFVVSQFYAYCKSNNYWRNGNVAVPGLFIYSGGKRGGNYLEWRKAGGELFRVAESGDIYVYIYIYIHTHTYIYIYIYIYIYSFEWFQK